jgi:hypothetical protein
VDERKSRVIELRFFGGLSVAETAVALMVSSFERNGEREEIERVPIESGATDRIERNPDRNQTMCPTMKAELLARALTPSVTRARTFCREYRASRPRVA